MTMIRNIPLEIRYCKVTRLSVRTQPKEVFRFAFMSIATAVDLAIVFAADCVMNASSLEQTAL